MVDHQNKSLPSYKKKALHDLVPSLQKILDIWIGKNAWYYDNELVDEEKADSYLPRDLYEPRDAWVAKIARAPFERRFRDIIEKDYAGLLTRYTENDLPESFQESLNNIDFNGNNFKSFLRQADTLALRDGVCYVYVEAPIIRQGEQAISETERRERNLRPYLVLIPRLSFINWRLDSSMGNSTLTMAVIEEKAMIADGEYAEKEEVRYRVLFPGSFVVFRLVEQGGIEGIEIVTDENGNELRGETGLNFIPIVPYSLTSNNAFFAEIPFEDLADMNLELYQNVAEKKEILHKCNTPTLVINERDPDNYPGKDDRNNSTDILAVGSNSALKNLEAKWIEPSGVAISATQTEYDAINQRIDSKTISLFSGSQVERTATEADINATQTTANFSGLTAKKESNVQEIVKTWAAYSTEPVSSRAGIVLNREVIKKQIQVTFGDLLNGFTQGLISRDLALTVLKDKEVFGSSFGEMELKEELDGISSKQPTSIDDDTIDLNGSSDLVIENV